MNKKALKTLEYDKIMERLAHFATTPMGKERCQNLEPMNQLSDIELAVQETTDAADRIRRRGPLSFTGVRNILPSIKRLEIGSSLGIGELLSISSLLSVAARAKSFGREDDEIPEDSLTGYFDILEPVTPLNNEIKRCIKSEEEIDDNASPALRQIRRSMGGINARIHTQLNSLLSSHKSELQDAVVTMRNGRYCLPVKAENKGQISGMVHDQSSTGSTYFIEPMAVIKLNNEMRELEIKEQKEIEAILANLSNQTAAYTEQLADNLQALSQLDFIFAKAMYSASYKGSCPVFNEKGIIHIRDGRHPLLNPETVVPTTIRLGDDFTLLIITGPNTGGKTVSLKTTGLLQMMGQSGLHIPAFQGSQLAIFDEIYADIGDEQSIEQSLSTFSSHMTNIVPILEKADSRSLVLFDELGAGTDPVEGAALAMSILNYLHNMQVRTMATTHYSELKVYALSTDGVENASCEFNVETLSPTYRLLIGIPGKSNAFAISRKLGLEEHIIETANSYIGHKDKAFEDVISDLEHSRQEMEKEQEEIERLRRDASILKKRVEEQKKQLDERRDKIITQANEEARQILQSAKTTADQTIRRINKLGMSGGNMQQLEEERAKLRNQLKKNDQKKEKQLRRSVKTARAEDIKIGDSVRVLSLNMPGTVTSLPNARGDMQVQMGIMSSQVNIKDVELVKVDTLSGPDGAIMTGKKSGKGSHASQIKMNKSLNVSTEVNLIGMNADEAIATLDKYLDDAYLAHLPQVRVVHGRGTGVLKNAVHNHLKRLRYVKSYRLGTFGEGNTGVTIVTFDTSQ
ncbi:MAG: endonuclease MutS2 [Lachnospiraceae bacterium]|nr:endonuclease MutS2 [Lachnospiraceae bacterium]